MFGRILNKFEINEKYKVAVSSGGFMTCPEHIIITQTKFMIFNQEVYDDGSLCLSGIWKIETLLFNEKKAKLLIYHDGKMDSKIPFRYEIDNKDIW